MNLSKLRAELEADREWRETEIRRLQNRANALIDEKERDMYRRMLVLILYAHYEGFCKFAFQLYINAINQLTITSANASFAIAASSMTTILNELSNANRKSDIFRRSLPEDAKLHKFARQREFLERFDEFSTRPINIPEAVVDFESNLKPVILRKNLYRLGLREDMFSHLDGQIDQLLLARNGIAHGSTKSGIDSKTYSRLRACAFKVMSEVLSQISRSLASEDFRRRKPIPLSAPI
ncbi:MAG: hypothetical protein JWQ42_128 [Edaphobacter sp.]|nr:hypothetical protein [Edaphobacter sp.]